MSSTRIYEFLPISDMYVKIGSALKRVRDDHKLTKVKLAKVLNCRRDAIHDYETGRAKIPIAQLLLFIEYFDLDANQFFRRLIRRKKPQISKLKKLLEKIDRDDKRSSLQRKKTSNRNQGKPSEMKEDND